MVAGVLYVWAFVAEFILPAPGPQTTEILLQYIRLLQVVLRHLLRPLHGRELPVDNRRNGDLFCDQGG